MSEAVESTKKTEKTWKREVAMLLFLGLGVLAYNGDKEMASIFVWPITVFGLGAFGLDATSKQLQPFLSSK